MPKLRERNEALDCWVYARAAAAIIGLDRYGEEHWTALGEQLEAHRPAPAAEPGGPAADPGRMPRRPKRRSAWLGEVDTRDWWGRS